MLGVLEAMKMELSLKAPFAGTVTAVGAAAGDQVAARRDAVRGREPPTRRRGVTDAADDRAATDGPARSG